MNTYAPDRLSRRHAVGQKAQVASASSAAAALIRALLQNPNVRVGPVLHRETGLVFSWLDNLVTCSQHKALAELIDDDKVTDERYDAASLIARAATMPRSPTGTHPASRTARAATPSTDGLAAAREQQVQKALAHMLAYRDGVSLDDGVVRVVDAKKAGTLADQLETVSSVLVEDAYEMDRERSGQFAVA